MLHSVPRPENCRTRRWCGPTAVAAITGCGYDAAIDAFRQVRGKPTIKGVYGYEMNNVMGRMGYKLNRMESHHHMKLFTCMTLAEFLRRLHPMFKDKVLLVNVTRHYVVVYNGRIIDTHTLGKIVPASKYPKRRKRVVCVHVVERMSSVLPMAADAA